MDLYVLAEDRGLLYDAQSGQEQELVELFGFPSQAVGDRIALFISPLDAAICKQYLNRQSDGYRKNNYGIRLHTDPAVVFNVTTSNARTGMGVALIVGFNTDNGQLYIQDRSYKLAAVALSPSDMRSLFLPPRQLNGVLKSSLLAMLMNYESNGSRSTPGAFSVNGLLNELDHFATMNSNQIDQIAEIALARTGARLVRQSEEINPTGFCVYSVNANKWYILE